MNSDIPADRTVRDVDHSLRWLLESPDEAPAAVPANRWARQVPLGRWRVRLGTLATVLALGLALIAAITLMWRQNGPQPHRPAAVSAAQGARIKAMLDAPFAPAALRPLSASQAQAWNAAVPDVAAPNPAARTFMLGLAKASDYERSRACLASAVYYEAGNEPLDGQRAVAQVILNRLRHPAFPHTVCGVVFQGVERKLGCQFTFTCDGAMARKPTEKGWARSQAVADAALGGYVFAPVGWATHYHANYVVPYWASSLAKVATIGAHVFYRWSGRSGTSETFNRTYAGSEPDVRPLMALPPEAIASGTLGNAVPVDVSETERPVLIGGGPAAAASRPRASVGDSQRWIIAGPARGSTRAVPPAAGQPVTPAPGSPGDQAVQP